MRLLLLRVNSQMAVSPPPVGLGYLSHAVKQNRGDEVLIVDGRRFRLSKDMMLKRVSDFNPDVIGIGAMTYEAIYMAALASQIKESYPTVPIVLGGPHVTAVGPSLLDSINADYLVTNEGEDTLVELLNTIDSGGDPARIAGLAWKNRESEVVFNGPREFIEDLDKLDIDWEAIGPEEYFSQWRRNAMNTIAHTSRRLPVFTSRGCPYGCAYCHHIFGRKFRTFDIENTVARMVDLRDRYRVQEFEIIEDIFNLKLERAKAFLHEVIDRKLGCWLTLTNGLRADIMDEELLDLMVKAKIYRINYAIESASPRLQKLVHKNLDLDRAREVVNMTAERRIVTGTYNMLGFPGETEEELARTVDFAVSLKNHITSFFYCTPFPGTELADTSPEVHEKVLSTVFEDASEIAVNLSAVPDDVLKRTRQTAYRRFYLSPGRIARIWRDVPHNLRLLGAVGTALRLSFRENVNY